ncbi:MAG: hypothetical protein FJ316_09785 [SAR202 cluster bacterium]|nr:hypothetical protein [SAR202 cluster bacterium]
MRPVELTTRWLPRGVDGITLWPFIFYRRGYEQNVPLRCHEHYHWRHALRWGVIPWYLAYLALRLFYLSQPADQHPLEAPAYAKQREVQALLDAGRSIDDQLAELGMV